MSSRKSSSTQSRVPSIALFPKCISAALAWAVGWLRARVWSFISFAQSCVFISPGICSFNQSCGQMGFSSPGLKLQIYTKKSASHMCFHLPFNTNKANTCLYQQRCSWSWGTSRHLVIRMRENQELQMLEKSSYSLPVPKAAIIQPDFHIPTYISALSCHREVTPLQSSALDLKATS